MTLVNDYLSNYVSLYHGMPPFRCCVVVKSNPTGIYSFLSCSQTRCFTLAMARIIKSKHKVRYVLHQTHSLHSKVVQCPILDVVCVLSPEAHFLLVSELLHYNKLTFIIKLNNPVFAVMWNEKSCKKCVYFFVDICTWLSAGRSRTSS